MDLTPQVVFSPHYDIKVPLLEKLHPFDVRKYGRAWNSVKEDLGDKALEHLVMPRAQASREELLAVHSAGYLDALKRSSVVAGIIEVPQARHVPAALLDYFLLRAMRWGVSGTILGAEEAMKHGLAINLCGGYHHAAPENGEGFCVYADIALAVRNLRDKGLLRDDDRVLYIDCDAHQGNGVSYSFMDDPRVKMFDMYNERIYPAQDRYARERIDCDVPLDYGTDDATYLGKLRERLPAYLDELEKDGKVPFAIYNAGTDIFAGDRLGGMKVSTEGVFQRDSFVLQTLLQRRIPTLMLPSGGYSKESYRMIAATVRYALTELVGAVA